MALGAYSSELDPRVQRMLRYQRQSDLLVAELDRADRATRPPLVPAVKRTGPNQSLPVEPQGGIGYRYPGVRPC